MSEPIEPPAGGDGVAFAAGAAANEAEHASEEAEQAEQTAEGAEQVAEAALGLALDASAEASEAQETAEQAEVAAEVALISNADLLARLEAIQRRLDEEAELEAPATTTTEPTMIEVEPDAQQTAEQGPSEEGSGGESVEDPPRERSQGRRGFRRGRRS